jgi:hypothetical protein
MTGTCSIVSRIDTSPSGVRPNSSVCTSASSWVVGGGVMGVSRPLAGPMNPVRRGGTLPTSKTSSPAVQSQGLTSLPVWTADVGKSHTTVYAPVPEYVATAPLTAVSQVTVGGAAGSFATSPGPMNATSTHSSGGSAGTRTSNVGVLGFDVTVIAPPTPRVTPWLSPMSAIAAAGWSGRHSGVGGQAHGSSTTSAPRAETGPSTSFV